jgi:hypothetical protein
LTHLDPIEYDIPKDPGKITLPKPQEPNIMYSILVADDERWIRKGIIKMIDAKKLEINEIYEADSITAAPPPPPQPLYANLNSTNRILSCRM